MILVAPEFVYEHANTLHWLNQCSKDELSFYGVKVEVVMKPDDSKPLPPISQGGQSRWLEQGHYAATQSANPTAHTRGSSEAQGLLSRSNRWLMSCVGWILPIIPSNAGITRTGCFALAWIGIWDTRSVSITVMLGCSFIFAHGIALSEAIDYMMSFWPSGTK